MDRTWRCNLAPGLAHPSLSDRRGTQNIQILTIFTKLAPSVSIMRHVQSVFNHESIFHWRIITVTGTWNRRRTAQNRLNAKILRNPCRGCLTKLQVFVGNYGLVTYHMLEGARNQTRMDQKRGSYKTQPAWLFFLTTLSDNGAPPVGPELNSVGLAPQLGQVWLHERHKIPHECILSWAWFGATELS